MRWIILSLMLVSCGSNIRSLQPEELNPLTPNTFIESLREGAVEGECVIQGSVTTSDSCGNFYQSIIVQDPTGVMELRFSFYDSYAMFKRGDVVAVTLTDHTLKSENGILFANMGSFAIASKNVHRQGSRDEIAPRRLTIPEINASHTGRLIEISGGTFNNGGNKSWSGEQKYSVGKNSITIYTSPYATYANETLPVGTVSLTGIVTLYNDKIQLKLSSPDDCRNE